MIYVNSLVCVPKSLKFLLRGVDICQDFLRRQFGVYWEFSIFFKEFQELFQNFRNLEKNYSGIGKKNEF
jgi:hypothetical protein